MIKHHRQFAHAPAKQTKHQQEMEILRAYHERVLGDRTLREATLVGAGVFVRNADGMLVVAKQYDQVIVPKRAA